MNEQGIMNIHFNCKLNIWKQILFRNDQAHYYCMREEVGKKWSNYIMLKN